MFFTGALVVHIIDVRMKTLLFYLKEPFKFLVLNDYYKSSFIEGMGNRQQLSGIN